MKTIVILSHVAFDKSPYCIYVHEHAKALKKAGYNVIVFAILNWIPFAGMIKKDRKKHYKEKKGTKNIDGVTVIYKKALSFSNLLFDSKINLNGVSYYLSIKRKMKKILKENDVLFVDAHTFKVEGYVASLLHRKMGIQATVTCHGTSLIRTTKCKNAKFIIQNIVNNINYAIFVSDYLQNQVKPFNVNNTKVIHNGINFYDIPEKPLERKINILTVGSLVKRKNIDIVIKTFKKICMKVENAKLVVVGNGAEKEKLQELVKQLEVENKVEFIDYMPNKEVYMLMKQSNIFLLPSVAEGFGIVYAEAMHNGCITIATKNEGIDGFIKNGENGFLVNPNEEEIAKLIMDIYTNQYNIEDIRKNAIMSSKNLTWDRNAEEYVKLFI